MTKIKICGLTSIEDIHFVNEAKPDYIGFVFAAGKRQISLEQAEHFKSILSKEIKAVGVFVNENIDFIAKLCRKNIIDLVQLHGDEDEKYMEMVRKKTDKPIIKAVRVGKKEDVICPPADYTLFDSYSKSQYGGTGERFDWGLVRNYEKPFFLAGGIDLDNAKSAMEKLRPYCLDVSSGVETYEKKDREKIIKMVNIVRGGIKMAKGRFGAHGGQYIPETLMNAVIELENAYNHYKNDRSFNEELQKLLNEYAGRPSRLYFAERMTTELGGAKIYLKREDLNHTGSHKINNVLGQALLAKKMGKKRVIAETGAGQHGVATATAAVLLGLECEIFMGKEDIERQALNVYRMKLLGSKVNVVTSGTMTLKDAVNETMREWTTRVTDTHYILGSAVGPHPFPEMVRDFQSVISKEARAQILEKENRLPNAVIACVGGGSNAIGSFYNFIPDKGVRLIGCEAAGKGIETALHAATITKGSVGVFHGMKAYFCQDEFGQIAPVYSISAGLDYPGVGPEHSYLHDMKRAEYVPVTDAEAIEGFEYLSKTEGIIPAIESAHAVSHAVKIAPAMKKDDIIIIILSGRGDKDVAAIARHKGEDVHE